MAEPRAGSAPMRPRARKRLLEQIGRPDGHVRGFHGGCPNGNGIGSSYNALFLDEFGCICCRECGAVDLDKVERGKSLRQGASR